MEEMEQQFSTRDRMMRLAARRMTPAERLARMEAMQNAAWNLLNTSPPAFERFWRRNVRDRSTRRRHASEAAGRQKDESDLSNLAD
jgi:hypothetical protein